MAEIDALPLTAEERAQAHRHREAALRDPDRYWRPAHMARLRLRRKQRRPATVAATSRPRPREAGPPAARRTSSSSTSSSADPGDPDPEFSGAARDTLSAAELAPGRTPVVGLLDGVPFGFLMLDVGPEVRVYAPGDGVVGVRGVYVDATCQGRGLGTAMLRELPAFARGRHPGATRLVLTVNVTNPRAIRTYLKAGFCDTGRLYHGGRLGPQHVLELAL